MRVFVDTNVVVDFLGKREPFFDAAAIIFEMERMGIIDIVVSSLTIVNCVYILSKTFSKEVMLRKMNGFCRLLKISPIDKSVIINALSLYPNDFEDAVQFESAISYQPDIIITRDRKGYSDFAIPVMTPDEFVAECKK